MRPVLLEIDGFASFREHTVVDFSGAEYFALVGPTGSGKSTIIDALTFALYGSVPRWDNPRTVSLALAPTAGRGAVRLVFDVGGGRYVVARELRRNPSTEKVTVRNARLERLPDKESTGSVDEETEPLADGAVDVTAAVTMLLGLPFEEFTTCVVLPQGDFAEFLHAEPRKRQEKLVRILGLGMYDQIAKEANAEAAGQKQRADILTEQLGSYADATADAAADAAARTEELDGLSTRVADDVAALTDLGTRLRSAREEAARLAAESSRLGALAEPVGLAELDERRRSSSDALAAAADLLREAEQADTAARDALTAAPARAPLERARRGHAEHTRLVAQLPGLREQHEKAGAAYDTAVADAAEARTALDAAREARSAAVTAAQQAREAVTRLTRERDGLAALAAPPGLAELDRRRSAVDHALERAGAALAAAEADDTRARDRLAEAPARGPLEQARRDHTELVSALREHEAAQTRLADATAGVDAADTAVREATHALEHARTRRAAAQRADLAAALRPSLVVGDACPVCAQAVATLPPVPDALDPASVEAVVSAAESGAERARTAAVHAAAARDRADADVSRAAGAITRYREALAAMPGADWVAGFSSFSAGSGSAGPGAAGSGAAGADVAEFDAAALDAALAELDRLADVVTRADSALRAARREREDAAREADAVRREDTAAAASLRAARDPLVPFGAPSVDPDGAGGVLAGWSALVEWARGAAAQREDALPEARAGVAAAGREHDTAEQALRAADRAASDRRHDETTAARAEQESRSAVATATARVDELAGELRDAPSDTDASAALERLDALEDALREADRRLRTARAGQGAAQHAAAEVEAEVRAAWDSLRHARDPLVPLGAPAAAGEHLRVAWTELLAWARGAVREREGLSGRAEQAARDAVAERDSVFHRLVADLAAHGLSGGVDRSGEARGSLPGGSLPSGGAGAGSADDAVVAALVSAAPSSVAVALERARGAEERLADRRTRAGRIAADRDAAEEARGVAKMLGNLLRSDGFPRWLVASALDALVADASRSLAELSGGQFELTHSGGEFLVVDHADADSRRPVKTLSGGETFQASLALALALSAQMAGLAAHGAATLESIFLDEGFGTLDEANLDVVASTLENLAARGDRMVGVVTHVPALAERVPVRFVVSRDQRTSSVTRENR